VSGQSSDVPRRRSALVQSIVLDVEGTTTPIAFVYDVLFPFVRTRLHTYLSDPKNRFPLTEPLRRLREEWEGDADHGPREGTPSIQDPESFTTYIERLTDQDRKSPGLKLLQGQVWEEGYRSGELTGDVFPDVAPALRQLKDAGIRLAFLSNFTAAMLDAAVKNSGLEGLLEEHLSTDRVRAYKPDPRAYQMGLDAFGAKKS